MPSVLTILLSLFVLVLLAVWIGMLIAEPRLIRRRKGFLSDSGLPYGADRGNDGSSGDSGGGGGD